MSEQDKAITAPTEGGHPSGQPSAPPEGGQVVKQDFVTREEARQMAKEAAEAAYRQAQSLFDKGQLKVRERVAQLEKTFQMQADAGIEISEEQKARLRQQVSVEALTESEQSEPSEPQPSPAEEDLEDDELDPVTLEAWRMMDEANIEIVESDPEFQTLDMSSQYAFLKSVEAAIEAKRQRTAPNKPEVRIPGLGGAGQHASALPDMTPIQRLNDYFKKKG